MAIQFRGNYHKMLYMDSHGNSYFSMTATKDILPYDSMQNTFVATGKVPEYNLGYPLTLIGEWKIKNCEDGEKKYKFIVEDYIEDINSNKVLFDFFCTIDGIGEKTAEKLSILGKKIWEYIAHPDGASKISEECGVSYDTGRYCISYLQTVKGRYETFQYLKTYGVSDLKVDRLIKIYGSNVLESIKKNPYKTLLSVGVPFDVADEIAYFEHIPAENRTRLQALIRYSMECLLNNGSTYVSLDELLDAIQTGATQSVYKKSLCPGDIAIALNDAWFLYFDKNNDLVYFYDVWTSEEKIARGLRRLQDSSTIIGVSEKEINEIEEMTGLSYAKKQREAFHILDDTTPKILTGGPGTGKTTMINSLIQCYRKKFPEKKIALAAPTGMASEHMAESTGLPATTIHRLLDYRPFGEYNASYKDSQNPIDADFVVIDEMSMGDTKLIGMLLDAIRPGTLLLLCGDADQLDSVGNGQVLRDLIHSNTISCFSLDVIFRQAEASKIISNAEHIKAGEPITAGEDFKILRYHSKDELDELLDLWMPMRRLQSGDVQVISTTKKGNYGTKKLNFYLQKKITFSEDCQTLHRNGFVFHEGDRVMTIKNNFHAGYFNGDVGIIQKIQPMGDVILQMGKRTIYVSKSDFEDIIPAYCITTHKAQGSEFPYVFIILPKNPSILLDRSILYTAVTRAKEKVFIISEDDALEMAIEKNRKISRQTGLIDKLKTI